MLDTVVQKIYPNSHESRAKRPYSPAASPKTKYPPVSRVYKEPAGTPKFPVLKGMNLNKVFVIGRVTANPELRRTQGGASVTSFGVATNRVWTDKVKGKQEETEFHNIVAWGRSAEIASQFLTKGATVLIEGRLRTRSWQDKQGINHRTTEIICEALQLGPKPMGQGQAGGGWGGGSRAGADNREEEEAPQAKPEDIPVINLDEEPAQGNDEIPF